MMGMPVLALGLMFLVFSACPSESNGAITCTDALTSLIPC